MLRGYAPVRCTRAMERDTGSSRRNVKCVMPSIQGLTLVHFSAQLEPCLTHKKPYTP